MRLGINGHGVTGAYAILKRTVKIAAAANGCGTAPPRGKIVVFFSTVNSTVLTDGADFFSFVKRAMKKTFLVLWCDRQIRVNGKRIAI